MNAQADPAPWVIVAGGFHDRGGMDRANAALAQYLLGRGVAVSLVGHEIADALGAHPLATVHPVPRPRGLVTVAERLLARAGVRAAADARRRHPGARVVVNGGNCPWPDVNWVHAVHAAWPVHDPGAPWWSRGRNRRLKAAAIGRERLAIACARTVVTNSRRTSRDVIRLLGADRTRVHTVHLGSDPAWGAAGGAERAAARQALGLPADAPVVCFVGALGSDLNKGFDRLWEAWTALARRGSWDAHLVVAGGGWRLGAWQAAAAHAGLASSVHFLGVTGRVRELLAAGDLLVSPVRYEAYGLNVHEALCRGLGVLVSEHAGVVERFEPPLRPCVLPAGADGPLLASRLREWRADVQGWKARAVSTADRLRGRTWTDMAAELVETVAAARQRVPA